MQVYYIYNLYNQYITSQKGLTPSTQEGLLKKLREAALKSDLQAMKATGAIFFPSRNGVNCPYKALGSNQKGAALANSSWATGSFGAQVASFFLQCHSYIHEYSSRACYFFGCQTKPTPEKTILPKWGL